LYTKSTFFKFKFLILPLVDLARADVLHNPVFVIYFSVGLFAYINEINELYHVDSKFKSKIPNKRGRFSREAVAESEHCKH
jgi:hypothetical protein